MSRGGITSTEYRQQWPNGFVSYASFVAKTANDDAAHARWLAAEGLLDSGVLLNETRYIDAARRIAVAV